MPQVTGGNFSTLFHSYVLGVGSDHAFTSWGKARPVAGTAGTIAQGLPAADWTSLSAGDGTKGARLHDWAYLELADLDAADDDDSRTGLWTRGLLIRRRIADGDLAFFTTWCPAGTDIETLVRVEGPRWAHRGQLRDRQKRTWSRP